MGDVESQVAELALRVLDGNLRAVARGVRLVDDRDPRFVPLLKRLFPHTGRAYVVGVTGAPGAGKSTLVDRLIEAHRAQGRKVAVVAVDPSSPYSGGALLGDRIRLQRHFTDERVFIRSLATRGHLGGLSRSAADVTRLLDAAGFDVVLVETVGVGQDELEIARLAHTTVVVMAPGLGDEIQAIKAGILEVADVFAVNKADRDGADATIRDLEQTIALGQGPPASGSGGGGHMQSAAAAGARRSAGPSSESGAPNVDDEAGSGGPDPGDAVPEHWTPAIVRCVATRGEGIADVVAVCARHHRYLFETSQGQQIVARRLKDELSGILREALVAGAEVRLGPQIEEAAARVARRETDPYTEVETLVTKVLGDRGDRVSS